MARKAALYLRSSKDRHDVSIDSQERELRRYAESAGDKVIQIFSDKIESAKTDERPGFQALINEARSKNCQFKVLYCYDTSRFARRQYHAQMYKHLLKKKGIQLVFLKLPKTDTILDPIIESLMEAFDEFHSQKSKLDGLRGMKENIDQGWRAGGKAILGYKLEKHVVGTRDGNPITKSKLIPDPKSFYEVQKYLKGRARGEARKSLASSLKIKVPYSSLVYLEDNVLTFAGHTVWNRHNEFADGAYIGGRYRNKDEWVIKRNTHPAMITDKEAESINKIRELQSKKQSRFRRNHYLLSTLITCDCGANMDGDSGYYRCHDRCGVKSIKKETIEQAVLSSFSKVLLSDNNLIKLKNIAQKLIKEKLPKQNLLISQLETESKSLRKQINELTSLLTEVKHKRPILEQIDSFEDKLIELDEQIVEAKKFEKPSIVGLSNEKLEEFAKHWRDSLFSGTMDKRKAVFRQLLKSAKFDGETLEITPSYESITGVKMASPRGFEPLLPP